jgi:iron(III) transport system substrate-binding protein
MLLACGDADRRRVVVYTSHDQILSEPILDLFEQRTGVEVLPAYDTEATKTTGLVNRIIAEAARPRCDVFWNNEIVQTMRLVDRGLTQPHRSPSAAGIPEQFRDPGGQWTGFAARARVIVVNEERVDPVPPFPTHQSALWDFAGASGLALPLFGTTATHFTHIFTEIGPGEAADMLRELLAQGVAILDSNGQVCDAVARGALSVGWTDTDDVAVAIAEGRPVAQVIPDEGAILIPNTVAMIAGAPHPDEARQLIDFLLSPEVERLLAEGAGAQIPLHPDVPVPPNVLSVEEIKLQWIDWPAVAANFDDAMALVNRILVEGE